jgi:hypothetical protein
MPTSFLGEVRSRISLTDMAERVLTSIDVRSWEDIHSLAAAFPSLSRVDLALPTLSNAAVLAMGLGAASASIERSHQRSPIKLGAAAPPNALFTLNARVGVPPPTTGPVPAAGPPPGGQPPIDLRRPNWPVRNQDQRGTCVAHGAAACVENSTVASAPPDLSEQFLYWAIKTNTPDPYPNDDGTWLLYANQALTSDGICAEVDWPYVRTVVNPVSGAVSGQPTATAIAAANGNRLTGTVVQSPIGAASTLLGWLQQGIVAGICLPVFADPLTPAGPTNWSTNVGFDYGRVLNPPPTSQVVGGHCVCVTGFIYDPAEPNGGYFIIRNSWDTTWGSLNSTPGHGRAPEQGYGDISATYVDKYCWELFHL